jgi:hypothetical protein
LDKGGETVGIGDFFLEKSVCEGHVGRYAFLDGIYRGMYADGIEAEAARLQ